MSSFERLVVVHLTGPLLDSLVIEQTGLWMIPSIWDCIISYNIWTNQGLLAFNTIIPNILLSTLTQLRVPTSICEWISSFQFLGTAISRPELGHSHLLFPQ